MLTNGIDVTPDRPLRWQEIGNQGRLPSSPIMDVRTGQLEGNRPRLPGFSVRRYLTLFYTGLFYLGIGFNSLNASDGTPREESKGTHLRINEPSNEESQLVDDDYYDEDEYDEFDDEYDEFDDEYDEFDDEYDEFDDEYEETDKDIRDPLYYWNVGMFTVNDRLYFWVLKPIAKGYSKVLPEKGRVGVKNFFVNLSTPIRLVNCLLQGKFNAAGVELAAFTINSTIGVIGFGTPAKSRFNLDYALEDLGQTLAVYGIGNGFYLMLPLFGPSSLRDTFGLLGDSFLTPVNYLPFFWRLGVRSFQNINDTSLKIGDYEQLLQSAISPYDSLRNVYVQFRNAQIEK